MEEFIAADFNNDGYITAFDAVQIINAAVNGILPTNPEFTSWEFISIEEYNNYILDLPPWPTSPVPPYDPFIEVENVNSSILFDVLDFYGIKNGDVDNSCTDCDGDGPEFNNGNDGILKSACKSNSTYAGYRNKRRAGSNPSYTCK